MDDLYNTMFNAFIPDNQNKPTIIHGEPFGAITEFKDHISICTPILNGTIHIQYYN